MVVLKKKQKKNNKKTKQLGYLHSLNATSCAAAVFRQEKIHVVDMLRLSAAIISMKMFGKQRLQWVCRNWTVCV
jgi:hypothetical protein